MTSTNRSDRGDNGGDERRTAPAVDVEGAAVQDQVKADADALRASARRVDASLPANGEAATDPAAAAIQDQIREDHDALQEQARRVEASVSEQVRSTPVQPAGSEPPASEDTTAARRNSDAAHANAEAAREGARRVDDSLSKRSD
jgi:hypothetical protein